MVSIHVFFTSTNGMIRAPVEKSYRWKDQQRMSASSSHPAEDFEKPSPPPKYINPDLQKQRDSHTFIIIYPSPPQVVLLFFFFF